jgi:ketopantoate hydroxymethyltransferase
VIHAKIANRRKDFLHKLSTRLGLSESAPSFVRQYAQLADTISSATASYVREVKEHRFPERTLTVGATR